MRPPGRSNKNSLEKEPIEDFWLWVLEHVLSKVLLEPVMNGARPTQHRVAGGIRWSVEE